MPLASQMVGLLLIACTSANPLPVFPLDEASCPPVQIIAARGTNQAPGMGPALSQLATTIKQKLPNLHAEGLQYPASMLPTYEASEMVGVRNMTTYIKSYADMCPKTKQVIMGYSQGAQVAMDALCGVSTPGWPAKTAALSASYREQVKAIVVYGDPSHRAGMPYNRGTSTHNGVVRRPFGAECLDWADRIASWCDSDDPYCDGGNDMAVHHSYKDNYNKAAYDFVMRCHARN